jgi:cell division protein FtsX
MVPDVRRRLIPWVVAGLVVSALFWIDPLFIPLALLGPIVTGALAAWTGRGLRLVLLMWAVAGLGAVVSDFVVNQEDVVFHLVLTVVMIGLAAGGWAALRAIRHRR